MTSLPTREQNTSLVLFLPNPIVKVGIFTDSFANISLNVVSSFRIILCPLICVVLNGEVVVLLKTPNKLSYVNVERSNTLPFIEKKEVNQYFPTPKVIGQSK